MFYRVTRGQSPAMVARALGTSVSALMSANSHKPTTVVAGRRTFQSLRYNELLHKPSGGALGEAGTLGAVTPADPAAPHALIAAGSSGPDVALWQKIIGVTADGSFGSGTAAATQKWQTAHGLPADGKVGPNTWAKALGNASSAPVAVTAPSAGAGPGLAMAAGAAYSALNMDPNYCTSVAKAGTAVNTAVHNFKAAWNAAHPGQAVPIGTGKYEPSVAAALSSALAGVTVPTGCGGVAAPLQPAPVTRLDPGPGPVPTPPPLVTPVPSGGGGSYTSGQIIAAAAMNDALAAHGYKQTDMGLYKEFQRSMGIAADGYPGTGTMGRLAAVLASQGIPMAQVPIYPWHAGAWDGKNAPTAASWSGASAPVQFTPAPSAAPVPVAAAAAAAAAAASTPPQADAAAAAAQAAIDSAARAAAAATTQKQADDAAAAAKVAQSALDTAVAKGGTPPAGAIEKKKLSTGAIVAGAVGAAAVVGLLAMALTGKKKSRRGARGPSGKRGKRGPAKRKTKKRARR